MMRGGSRSGTGLVIFDCDGVLVDSEPISAAVLREVLGEAGCEISEAEIYGKLLGRSIPAVAEILGHEYGIDLTEARLERFRERVIARFRVELRPIAGVAAAIGAIGAPVCVASSSSPERIRLSLDLTGLSPLFGDAIFSASMVARGKPAPDIFLHAAREMGAAPGRCVVVEDSPAGIRAAQAAGMRVVAFTGGGHAAPAGLAGATGRLSPDASIADMADLPAVLESFAVTV